MEGLTRAVLKAIKMLEEGGLVPLGDLYIYGVPRREYEKLSGKFLQVRTGVYHHQIMGRLGWGFKFPIKFFAPTPKDESSLENV